MSVKFHAPDKLTQGQGHKKVNCYYQLKGLDTIKTYTDIITVPCVDQNLQTRLTLADGLTSLKQCVPPVLQNVFKVKSVDS